MKLFLKLIILAVIAAIAAPFFLKKTDGTPFLDWRDFVPQNPIQSVTNSVSPDVQSKMYKWQDEKGHWQFGDRPPEGVQAQEMQVKTQINAMKNIELPEGFGESSQADRKERFDPTQKASTPFSTAPISEVPKMMDQIKDYQKTLDERQKSLDSL